MQVYKVPEVENYTILEVVEVLRSFVGLQGSRLNPIQDKNGVWIVSVEEWNAEEFEHYKTEYAEIIPDFELIDFEPIEVEIL